MERIASIQLSGDIHEFVSSWNSNAQNRLLVSLIELDPDSKEYRDFHERFRDYSSSHNVAIREWILLRHSADELVRSKGLSLLVRGYGGESGSGSYEFEHECTFCGLSDRVQVTDLNIDIPKEVRHESHGTAPLWDDFCLTSTQEILVSDRTRDYLERSGVPGLEYRIVRSRERSSQIRHVQLVPRFEVQLRDPQPAILRRGQCPQCGRYKAIQISRSHPREGSELEIVASPVDSDLWIAQSTEQVGIDKDRYPLFFISGPLLSRILNQGFTGISAYPATMHSGAISGRSELIE